MSQSLQAILDLAKARLRDERVTDVNVKHDLTEIVRIAEKELSPPVFCKNCPHAGFLHPTPYCSNFEPLE